MKKIEKIARVKKYLLPVEITQDGEFFVANCPEWPDCYSQGQTIDTATAEIIAVASGLIELYEEEGLKIPLEKVAEEFISQKQPWAFQVPVFATA